MLSRGKQLPQKDPPFIKLSIINRIEFYEKDNFSKHVQF